jgi:hypothetical protein
VPPFISVRNDRAKSDMLGPSHLNLIVVRYAASTYSGNNQTGHSRAVAVPLWLAGLLAGCWGWPPYAPPS